MRLLLNGIELRGIQIGAVGTLKDYRNKGYARTLMEQVLDEYSGSTDIFFLFANDSVLDFYPKFGFKRYVEKIFIKETVPSRIEFRGRKLDLNSPVDYAIINRLLKLRNPITRRFGALDFGFVTAWHIFNTFRENLVYLENEDVVFILTRDKNVLNVWDVIFIDRFEVESSIAKLIDDPATSGIIFHFPPDVLNYKYDYTMDQKDSPLFIKGAFPINNQDFKFPVTART